MTRRDIFDASVAIALGLIGIAAGTAVALLLFTMCAGCVGASRPRTVVDLPAQTALERAAAETTLTEWSAAKLPAPRRDCRLMELRIEQPTTEAAYAVRCPWNNGQTWECLSWRALAPIAVMHPRLARARVGAHAQHALLHALMHCSGASGSADSYDGAHRELRVWEQGGPTSVEQTAERALDRVLKPGSSLTFGPLEHELTRQALIDLQRDPSGRDGVDRFEHLRQLGAATGGDLGAFVICHAVSLVDSPADCTPAAPTHCLLWPKPSIEAGTESRRDDAVGACVVRADVDGVVVRMLAPGRQLQMVRVAVAVDALR